MSISDKIFLGFMSTIFLASTVFLIYTADHVIPERNEEIAKSAEWATHGCPVYKSQCGSTNHSYACERRAAVVGRNQIGNIFVDAYPICKVAQ